MQTKSGIGAAGGLPALVQTARREPAESGLVIGLVNLMPQTAMRATEAQFRNLIENAPGGQAARLRLFTLADRQRPSNVVPLGPAYETLDALWDCRLDGLIVTGTEPQGSAMHDEPCWPALAKLVDWAADHTTSAIWSCFAAHAAVDRRDGIVRQALPEKLSGVFGAMGAGGAGLFQGVPRHWSIPHSRYNTLSEPLLRRAGYTILMHAPRVGADVFTKRCGNSQFLFFQGHPEYGPKTLLSEYIRDIRRFAAGQTQAYPKRPTCRLEAETIAALNEIEAKVLSSPAQLPIAELNAALARSPRHSWREPARQLYAGWLNYMAVRKPQSRCAP